MQIAIWRTLPVEPFGYWHHGVLLPDNSVIHFKSRASLRAKRHSKIVHSSLEKFRGRSTPRSVSIYVVRHRHPLPTNEVVRRARSQLGATGYNLLHNNCENFARWCVSGQHRSYQIENLQGALKRGYYKGLVPGALHAVAKTAAKDIPTLRDCMVPLNVEALTGGGRRQGYRERKKEIERERDRDRDRDRDREYSSSTEVAGVDVEVDCEGNDIGPSNSSRRLSRRKEKEKEKEKENKYRTRRRHYEYRRRRSSRYERRVCSDSESEWEGKKNKVKRTYSSSSSSISTSYSSLSSLRNSRRPSRSGKRGGMDEMSDVDRENMWTLDSDDDDDDDGCSDSECDEVCGVCRWHGGGHSRRDRHREKERQRGKEKRTTSHHWQQHSSKLRYRS